MPKKKEDLSSKLKDLIEELEKKAPITTEGTAINIQDIYLPLNHLFSQATKHAFKNQVKTLKPQRKLNQISTLDESVFIEDQVRFFAATAVGERKIFDAAKYVTEYVNELAARGWVTGYLTKLSVIRLASEPHELEKYTVFCFPSLTAEAAKHIDDCNPQLSIKEGEAAKLVVS